MTTTLIRIGEDLTDGAIFVMACLVSTAALAYTFLAGKRHGKTAVLRRITFRCVAATLIRPNWVFRMGVALVAISYAFVAYYRATAVHSPDVVKLVMAAGMSLTILSSVGLAVLRMLTAHSKAFALGWSGTDPFT